MIFCALRLRIKAAALERPGNSLARIDAISETANVLYEMFFAAECASNEKIKLRSKDFSNAGVYADTTIERHLRELTGDRESLTNIGHMAWLAFIPKACERAREELKSTDFDIHIVGEKWIGGFGRSRPSSKQPNCARARRKMG
jgi:hypothetical protein